MDESKFKELKEAIKSYEKDVNSLYKRDSKNPATEGDLEHITNMSCSIFDKLLNVLKSL